MTSYSEGMGSSPPCSSRQMAVVHRARAFATRPDPICLACCMWVGGSVRTCKR